MNVEIIYDYDDDDNHERIGAVVVDGEYLQLLSNDTSRSIWTDYKIVVKIDRGGSQGLGEAITWRKLSHSDRKYFAPLLQVGDGYVIQRYIPLDKSLEGTSSDDGEAAYDLAGDLFDKYNLNWDWQGWAQFGINKNTGLLCIHDYSCDGDDRYSVNADDYKWTYNTPNPMQLDLFLSN